MQNLVKSLMALGIAKTHLQRASDNDLFNCLSKHDAMWTSGGKKDSDKLYNIRRDLMLLHDEIWKAFDAILDATEDD